MVSILSPTRTGCLNINASVDAVTAGLPQKRAAAIPDISSITAINLPPNIVPIGLASFGKTISQLDTGFDFLAFIKLLNDKLFY
jgi:hypothetical protein